MGLHTSTPDTGLKLVPVSGVTVLCLFSYHTQVHLHPSIRREGNTLTCRFRYWTIDVEDVSLRVPDLMDLMELLDPCLPNTDRVGQPEQRPTRGRGTTQLLGPDGERGLTRDTVSSP